MYHDANIAITGRGIICAIGENINEVHESLEKGISGIEPTSYLHKKPSFNTVTGEVALNNTELA